VYAEDASQGFLPSAGEIQHLREPAGPWVRVDSGIRRGYEVPVEYDPMLAKVSAYGENRESAIRRLVRALREYEILGISTNLAYLCSILEHEAFSKGDTSTRFLEEFFSEYKEPAPEEDIFLAAAALAVLAPTAQSAPNNGRAGGDPYSPWRPGALR
jgi:acetyl/propionyl-CoA carboxylase alpha subunit